MPPAIPSDKRPLKRPHEFSEDGLYLDHLNYWLIGVQERYGLIAAAYQKEPDLAQGSDGFWDQLAKNENSDESRERVIRVVKLATARNGAELNKVLADYICTPWISFAQDKRPQVRFGAVDPPYENLHYQPETTRLSRFPAEEVMAVLSVLHLAQAGYLDQLRVCPICGQAFIGARNQPKTCSSKCSKRRHASTPEEKKRRADAARARYDRLFGVPRRRRAQGR